MNLYAKFPGNKGSVTIDSHKGWTELKRITHSIECFVSMETGSNCGDYGQLQFNKLFVSLMPDNNIIIFQNHLFSRRPFDEVIIQACSLNGKEAQPHVSLTLGNVLISRYDLFADQYDKQMKLLLELAFTKIETRYIPYDKHNRVTSPSAKEFNLVTAT